MMDTNYGVGVSNRYNLFLDEDTDPLEILKLQEEEKKSAKKEKTVAKDVKGKTAKSTGKKVEDVGKKVVRSVAALSESNRGDVGNLGTTALKRDENRTFSSGVRYENREEGGRGGRGGFRGRGGGGIRGRGRGGYFDSRGKREYERHSGTDKTGIKAVDKRDGGGAHNWGRATDDYENGEWVAPEETVNGAAEPEAPKPSNDDTKESPAENNEDKPGEGEEPQEKVVPLEPEEQQFTLEEWKALQQEKRNRPTYKTRQAGEGEDPKRWKNTFVLKKKPESSDEESEEDDDEEEEEDRNQSLAKLIPIVFSSGPARRGGRGRGRGGRGGERGGRNFDGERAERPARNRGGVGTQAAPKVDDENDFPAL